MREDKSKEGKVRERMKEGIRIRERERRLDFNA